MLVIRLFRTGKKNQPSFKIVVIDKRKSSTKGPYVEAVGFYNPLTKEKVLKGERIKYWVSVGAKPSDTVHNLLISEKVIEGKKKPVYMKKTKKEDVSAEAQEAKAERLAAEAPPEKKVEEVKEEKPTEEKPPEEKPTKEAQKKEKNKQE